MSTAAVAQALAEPVATRGAALAALIEDQWFDRKSARLTAKQLAKSLVSFANAEGGTIVIGIHDGRVEGINGAGDRPNEWRQAAMDHTRPAVLVKVRTLGCGKR